MTTPGPPGRPPNYSRTSGRNSQQIPDFRAGLLTSPGPTGGSPDHTRTSRRASEHCRTYGRVSRPHPDLQEGLRALLDLREGLLSTP